MIQVTSSGDGAAKILDGQPIIRIDDSIFVFDLNPDTLTYLKTYYESNTLDVTMLFQLEKYKDISLFKTALTEFIKYGIFYNQKLCDKSYVVTTVAEYTSAANAIWPIEQKAITKFNGRKWPQETFVTEMIPLSGYGGLSKNKNKIDYNNIISWDFQLGYSTKETTETYPFDMTKPTILPIPLDDGITLQMPSESGNAQTTYSIIYYYTNDYITFPIVETHTRPMGVMVTSHNIPQNTITVRVYKQLAVTVVGQSGDDSGGGGSGG